MIGIYKIENLVNGKIYIGQSINIEQRWGEHKSQLRHNKHHSKHLQASWSKYGENNFTFSILDKNLLLTELNDKEIYWINYYNTFDSNYGYNSTIGGSGTRKYSDDDILLACELNNNGMNPIEISGIIGADRKTIERWLHSCTQKGICNYEPQKSNWTQVICLNNFKVFESIKIAQEFYNIHGISACCKHKHLCAGELNDEYLLWMYLSEYKLYSQEEIEKYILNANIKLYAKRPVCLNLKKMFKTNQIAADSVGLKTCNSIQANCNNKTKFAGIDVKSGEKLVWVYFEDYVKMSEDEIENKIRLAQFNSFDKSVICLNTLEIFDSTILAAKWANTNKGIIKNCCRGTANSAGVDPNNNKPVTWMYYEDYIQATDEIIEDKLKLLSYIYTNPNKVMGVVCLNNLYAFTMMKDATKWCGLKHQSQLGYNLRHGKNKNGKHPETGEPLEWMLLNDYIEKFGESGLIYYQTA